MSDIVGLDSNVLIYAYRDVSKKESMPPDLFDKCIRSKLLLAKLMRSGSTIVLPAICVAELLVPVLAENAPRVVAKLNKYFHCASFDLRAAAIASKLLAEIRGSRESTRHSSTRTVIKSDVMIVSTVKSVGGSLFYSADNGCRQVASRILTTKDLPNDDPEDMFLRTDLEKGEFEMPPFD